jgi:ATP-dependent DNA ligase
MRGVWRSSRRSVAGGTRRVPSLFAFDLLELDGLDMRREPIETRKATLASLLRKGKPGVRLNEHIAHPNGAAPPAPRPVSPA